jgi:arylsulfatase
MEEVFHLGGSTAQGAEKGELTMGITRREFLKSFAAAGAGVLAPGLLGDAQGNLFGKAKPNIILIFPDEWRWDGLGTLGLAPVQTPNLDSIAKNGVIFSNCFTCGPLCMPARASLMTGQYVHEHGQWNNESPPCNSKSPSHVRRIRDEARYYTAVIGKTHLHDKSVLEGIPILQDWGFDYSDEVPDAFGLDRDDTSSWKMWIGDDKYAQFQAYMHNYWPQFVGQAPWKTPPFNQKLNVYPPNYNLTWHDHYDYYVGKRASDWIRQHHKCCPHQPFYLQVNFPGPHYPMNSTTEFRRQFNIRDMGQGILKHPQAPVAHLVKWSNSCYCTITDMTLAQHRTLRQIYFANQLMIDKCIGGILDALHDCKIDQNTWLFFSSDHGEMLGDHYRMYKIVFYESSTKVPLIIRPPSYGEGWISTGLTDHLDLTTTLLDLAGLSPMFPNHGTSLLDKVAAGSKGPKAHDGKEQVVSEVTAPSYSCPSDCKWCGPFENQVVSHLMLRTQKHKMNVELKNPPSWSINPVELYDLLQDPEECSNLIKNPGYSSVRVDMFDRVKAFLS